MQLITLIQEAKANEYKDAVDLYGKILTAAKELPNNDDKKIFVGAMLKWGYANIPSHPRLWEKVLTAWFGNSSLVIQRNWDREIELEASWTS